MKTRISFFTFFGDERIEYLWLGGPIFSYTGRIENIFSVSGSPKYIKGGFSIKTSNYKENLEYLYLLVNNAYNEDGMYFKRERNDYK
jgi:hypothetical protein